jgi:hypothetical protein
MKTQELKGKVADKATSWAGSAAGTVVDPKTGVSKIKAAVTRPGVMAVAVVLGIAYLIGRRSRHS